ncbi:ubiquinone biosynthesis protein COQ11 [Rhodotorula paludigena]|uniref:ubiquinone biosynthesis protein COQ11 n=1 Tax=Rhodotorula paludigena TaxID=86838 RepID=UPI0031791FA1
MKLCIFGGNGFVGSAIARKAVARGWAVTSLSRSGRPFETPAGHTPAWVHKVDWRKGTPFDRASYAALLPECDALVTTLGQLFETQYKDDGVAKPLAVLRAVAENMTGSRGNPLARDRDRTYERLNRDSAIELFDAFQQSRPSTSTAAPSPFVFISAEDVFRPFVPERYILSKRQAEEEIWRRAQEEEAERTRPIFVRPSLMYHPHLNPPSTLPATLLEATSSLHALIPPSLRLAPRPPPASAPPTSHLPPAYASLASLVSIPPIHVDAVGESVCAAIARQETRGVVDVARMRALLGFDPLGPFDDSRVGGAGARV